MIVKLYHRLARYADTPNKFNQLRIALENRITPLELDALTKDAGPYVPDEEEDDEERRRRRRLAPVTQADWCARVNKHCEGNGKTVPEPFRRQRRRGSAWFFSNGEDKKSKVLVLGFTSGARRMMMPMPVFLQHLDASMVDVLVFTDPDRDGFRRNFLGDENPLKKQISEIVNLSDYRGVVAIGTSGGGLPSVLVAIAVGANAVLSVGGNDPNDLRWMTRDGDDGAALVRRYVAAANGKMPDIYLLYSREYSLDANSAKALSAMVSAREVAYYLQSAKKGVKPIGHGVLQPMLNRGTVCSLFNATIFSKFSPTKTGAEEKWPRFISEPTVV